MSLKRTAKREQEREVLEGAYHTAFVAAFEECAAGRWGLFGQNTGGLSPGAVGRCRPQSVVALEQAADDVRHIRNELGHGEEFVLVKRLDLYRHRHDANDLGEPRLARQFLDELTVAP